MEAITVRYVKSRPKLKEPILIEGLPGVGNVGKLAAEHLLDELKAKKFAEIYSKDFPPQVFVKPDGTVELVKNEFYYYKSKKSGTPDLLILTGDYQGLTTQGQYELSDSILDIAEEFGVKRIFTLGGYGLGRMIKEPGVLGAATDKKLVSEMKKFGIEFREDEPGGGIVGASGLLLGFGALRGMEGICLMGETSGYLVDPKSARAVLVILTKILGVEIDMDELELRAKEIDHIAQQIREMERIQKDKGTGEDLRYIG
ncbi:MAG: proteasome assembly chaperone family protein [Thermoplasmata archaeon HGW-Thermoplasmata-1]|nr:MAG: proteasome assembly chaperone family protein [Thermoplasmata archaeon HGW-Thermoplasmata-1]